MVDCLAVDGIPEVTLSGCRRSDPSLQYEPRKTLSNRYLRRPMCGGWEGVSMVPASAGEAERVRGRAWSEARRLPSA